HGEECRGIAFNEVSLLRESRQSAKLRVVVDGVVRIEELMADGVLVATGFPLPARGERDRVRGCRVSLETAP
ncbi:MAG TPA: hypothetical protein VJR70_00725, partial [Stellaceae bacterium]|nr:hypothetical protein [Stellaceae bacterium]